MLKRNNAFNGLTTVNLELTSRCNKNCWMCGRRKIDKNYPEIAIKYGDMGKELALNIIKQIPPNLVIQFHSNGEPLLYPHLKEILVESKDKIRCFDTNAKLLLDRADDIIGNMEVLTVSVIENDPEGDEQYEIVKKFIKIKGKKPPMMVFRLLGDVRKLVIKNDIGLERVDIVQERETRWYELHGIIANRILHNPMGSFDYQKKVTVPEIGICLDLLNHILIDRFGDVYPCVRFNPLHISKLGSLVKTKLEDVLLGEKRQNLIKEHIKGNRKCNELCANCQFWGVPRGL